MYSAFFDMVKSVYLSYYNGNDTRILCPKDINEVYQGLTCVPPVQGNSYFNTVSRIIEQSFLKISDEKSIGWNSPKYYHVYAGNEPPSGAFVAARVVANISRQANAMEAACLLMDSCRSKTNLPLTRTINQFKILLGSSNNSNPVKMDKFVIYNFLPLQGLTSVTLALKEQMEFLAYYCTDYDPLPQFVWRPRSKSPVGFGEGHDSPGEHMGFSSVRAGCIFNIVTKNPKITLSQFEKLLSAEFGKMKLSINIPFINQCSQDDEKKWLAV